MLLGGPFGAPHNKRYDILLPTGLGIRANPSISILKDLLHNLKFSQERRRMNGEKLGYTFKSNGESRAYFY